jgi:hypothetical protein
MSNRSVEQIFDEHKAWATNTSRSHPKGKCLVWSELAPEEQHAMAGADWSRKECCYVEIDQAHLHLRANGAMFQGTSWKSVMADGMEGEKCHLRAASFHKVSLRRAQLRGANFCDSTLRQTALDRADISESWWNYATIDAHTFFDGAQGLETLRWPNGAGPRILLPDATGQEQPKPITAIGQTPLRHPSIHDAYLVGMRLEDGSTHIQCRSFIGSEDEFTKHIDTEVPKNYQKTHRLSLEFLHKELDSFIFQLVR